MPAHRAHLLAALALLLLTAPAGTDEPKGKKHALLIGVTEYNHAQLRPLKYTENDVEELAKLLGQRSAGFATVRVMTVTRGKKDGKAMPTADNVRRAIEELFAQKGRHDTVLLALSGHGVELLVKDPDGEKPTKSFGYFCPSDADFAKVRYSTGDAPRLVLMDDVFRQVLSSGAGTKLILLDACRNEIQADSTTRRFEAKKMSLPAGAAVLFSCKSGEQAWETAKLGKGHGVFFHYVLEGLRGKAQNSRREVPWSRLAEYVTERVSEDVEKIIGDGARQTPHGAQNFEGVSPVLVRGLAGAEPAPPKKDEIKFDGREVTNSIGMRLRRLPAGEFTMGSAEPQRKPIIAAIGDKRNRELFAEWVAQEEAHTVRISRPFLMGVFEVTQKQYREVMSANPSHFSDVGDGRALVRRLDTGELPAERVTWEDAVRFCERLSARKEEKAAGRVYRLPTEAEWEYACRAGTTTVYHVGDELTLPQANFGYLVGERGPLGRTAKVGSYRPNAWGLFDMHGNVWEWCSDWHHERYYQDSVTKDPRGPTAGEHRVIRGGGWNSMERHCRSAHRGHLEPTQRAAHTGFRVVCEEAK